MRVSKAGADEVEEGWVMIPFEDWKVDIGGAASHGYGMRVKLDIGARGVMSLMNHEIGNAAHRSKRMYLAGM